MARSSMRCGAARQIKRSAATHAGSSGPGGACRQPGGFQVRAAYRTWMCYTPPEAEHGVEKSRTNPTLCAAPMELE
jgi:hypothetical protein